MQMVINISDKAYEDISSQQTITNHVPELAIAIRNATVLPEHHGRLIDADKLSDYFNKVVENYEGNNPNTIVSDKSKFSTLAGAFRDVVSRVKNAPTVLEGSDTE